MPILDKILEPFDEQFDWSMEYRTLNTVDDSTDNHPFRLAGIESEKVKNVQILGVPHYPGYTLLRILNWFLILGHYLARGPIGYIGDKLESAEKAAAKYPLLLPFKLLFYLLKQPFKWAATGISATFQIADSILALTYSASCILSSLVLKDYKKEMAKNIAKVYFTNSINTLKVAVPRLLLTGLIGVAAYFLGPLGVAAFAGTMGTVTASLAVAGIGTVGVTAIQAAVLSIKDRCSPPRKGSTRQMLDSLYPGMTQSEAKRLHEIVKWIAEHPDNQQQPQREQKHFTSVNDPSINVGQPRIRGKNAQR